MYLVAFLLCMTPALKQPSVEVVTEIIPPRQIRQDDGRIGGTETKKVRQIMALAGIKGRINAYPWARSFKLAQSGANVLIYPMARNPERETDFVWLGVLYRARVGIVKLKHRHDIQLSSVKDANRYKISMLRGDHTHALAFSKGLNNFIESPDNFDEINLLFHGKVDFLLGDPVGLAAMADQFGFDGGQVVLERWLTEETLDLYLAISAHSDPALICLLQQAFERFNTQLSKESGSAS